MIEQNIAQGHLKRLNKQTVPALRRGGMIAEIGVWMFLLGLGFAVGTSTVFISQKEKELARKYVSQKKSNSSVDSEVKYAYIDCLIAKITRLFMGAGLVLVVVGYCFDEVRGRTLGVAESSEGVRVWFYSKLGTYQILIYSMV